MSLVCGRHRGVEPAEGGDERRVHVLRVHRAPTELEAGSGAGVRHEGHLESEVSARARGRVHAHAGHHPDHDDLLDVVLAQVLLEVGAEERVGLALGDQRLALPGREHDLRALGALLEEAAAGGAEVLDMDHGIAGGAERLEDLAGLRGGRLRLVQRHLAAREVVALDGSRPVGLV